MGSTMQSSAPVMPTTLKELIEYLAVRPRVIVSSDIPGLKGPRTFLRAACGSLWFRDHLGAESFMLLNCGLVNAETGIEIDPLGFTVTKFGRQMRFDYAIEGQLSGNREGHHE